MDIQLRTAVAVSRVLIQPIPSPLATLMTNVTTAATMPRRIAAPARAFQVPPQRRAKAMPTNPSASKDGILTVDDKAIKPDPATR